MLDDGVEPAVIMLAYVSRDEPIEVLNQAEIYWIDHLRAMGLHLLNIAPGGEGRRGPMSDEAKRRMSVAGKGRPKSAATRAAMSAAGKLRPPPPPRTPEWRAVHSAKMTGKRHSEETKAKMSATQKGRPQPKSAAFAKARPRGPTGRFL
jgi:hypothetical protein